MDWVSLSRDASGHFGMVSLAAQQASVPSPLVPIAEATAKVLASGLLKTSLSILKAAEMLGDVRDMSVYTIIFGNMCVLLNLDSTNSEAQRLVREAASSQAVTAAPA